MYFGVRIYTVVLPNREIAVPAPKYIYFLFDIRLLAEKEKDLPHNKAQPLHYLNKLNNNDNPLGA